METAQQTIGALVIENPALAKALHYLGVNLSEDADRTLAEVCAVRGINAAVVQREMQVVGLDPSAKNLRLVQYPADLVLAYLRHAHHDFIKTRLPFMNHLLATAEWHKVAANDPAHDVKFIFPTLAEDFIMHVYEEEDELFGYIQLLLEAVKGRARLSQVYYAMENTSISLFATEHEAHESEMAGMRALTNQYTPAPDAPLSIKVLYAELEMFERDLTVHANIENRILFPKALKLEHEVRYHLLHRSKLN